MSGAGASTPTEGEVELGYVIGSHGVRGDLRVRLHDSREASLTLGLQLRFRERGGGPLRSEHKLESLEPGIKKGELRMRVEGVRSREAADELRSHGLWIQREALPDPAEDEYYLVDTIGCPVFGPRGELELGAVKSVTTNGAQDLLEVEFEDAAGAKHLWLLPAIPGFVLDFSAGRVHADPPPGLMPEKLDELLYGPNSGTEGATDADD